MSPRHAYPYVCRQLPHLPRCQAVLPCSSTGAVRILLKLLCRSQSLLHQSAELSRCSMGRKRPRLPASTCVVDSVDCPSALLAQTRLAHICFTRTSAVEVCLYSLLVSSIEQCGLALASCLYSLLVSPIEHVGRDSLERLDIAMASDTLALWPASAGGWMDKWAVEFRLWETVSEWPGGKTRTFLKPSIITPRSEEELKPEITDMESKEEISDSDSGIILQSVEHYRARQSEGSTFPHVHHASWGSLPSFSAKLHNGPDLSVPAVIYLLISLEFWCPTEPVCSQPWLLVFQCRFYSKKCPWIPRFAPRAELSLTCGDSPDSPTSPIKDLVTHTRAMKLKHQSLEDRLELCLLELKKLCIREAELTGQLSSDYPLLPGEKPPRIRRRIGAAFKLSEESIRQEGGDPELQSLEADLALQMQIYEAARRLAQEEHLCKQVRRSRQQQCKREERKVKELQEAVFLLRLQHGRASPRLPNATSQRDPATSDDSSLSDAVALDEDAESTQSSHAALEPSVPPDPHNTPEDTPLPPPQPSPKHLPPQTLEGLRPGEDPNLGYERSPIQNSPWKESSLDLPYQKPRKPQSACSSRSSSPALTPVSTPADPRFGDAPLPYSLATIKNLPLRHSHSSSAPSTPELHARRQYSQSFRCVPPQRCPNA
ncbi:hypothetical protein JZ751_015808 [Albula glossodonta]|uniref:Cytohesin Ubiquitin Protein Inducing domain-containing protein n=1 Tax=Albula glossodonta TaxID=121402 RepID=A0A8T2MKV8_9TELE|nr:hypothetical protein JZ751_015808 [Albula glossodonta]